MMDLKAFDKKRICVAVSGGIDSMTLLHYLKNCANEYAFSLLAVHCEHGIRGEESVADCKFVENACKEWGIPLFVFSEDCPAKSKREKTSLETAARDFRLDCFFRLIKEGKADYIATAHHRDDEAETVLFRLLRGASLTGVGGMKEVDGWRLRPFLDWSRADIEEYAKNHSIAYRVDCTNFQLDATRNKLRLEILPKLNEIVSGASKNLARFATLATADDELLYEYSQNLLVYADEEIQVAFCEKKPLFTRACLTAMKGLGIKKDYTARHLEDLYALQNSERGSLLSLPQNVLAKKEKNGIVFFLKKEEKTYEKSEEKSFQEMQFDGGMYEVNVFFEEDLALKVGGNILHVDKDKIPQNARFRFRKEGDEFRPFGGGNKTLKKYFNEKKIPVLDREHLPLIAEENSNRVCVVCGVEIGQEVKATEDTTSVLYITTRKKKEIE